MSPSRQLINGWASVSQPQRRLRDWSRVRTSEQQGAPTPVANEDLGDHLEAIQSGRHG